MGITENKALVLSYFETLSQVKTLGSDLLAFLAEDVTWWIQPASPAAGLYEGKNKVRALFEYDAPIFSSPLKARVLKMVGEGNTVAAEVVITAKNCKGENYENYYLFLIEVENGKFKSVREYLDTLYAQRVLFEPAGLAH